jgi:hypothetical protein
MASDKALSLLREAKALFDFGAFTTLHQAEFFKAMEEELGSLSPVAPVTAPVLMPLVAPLPVIGASLNVTESSDRKV